MFEPVQTDSKTDRAAQSGSALALGSALGISEEQDGMQNELLLDQRSECHCAPGAPSVEAVPIDFCRFSREWMSKDLVIPNSCRS